MSLLLRLGVGALLLTALASAQDKGLVGELPATSNWKGAVRLAGDVTVPAGGTLVIEAGTVVTIAARDQSQAGYQPELVEIHVLGQLLVDGKAEAPVVFMPDDGGGEAGNGPKSQWHGIVLHKRKDLVDRRTIVRGAQFWRAFAAIQAPSDNALIEDCVFHSCSTGVEAGVAYKNQTATAAAGIGDPQVRRCRFTDCWVGVYGQGEARAHVEQCAFHRCRIGVGCSRDGWNFIQNRPGPRVVGCAFVEVGSGVHGAGVVRECWFLRCDRALRLSNYHDVLATSIDHVVFANNLVEDVRELVVGDSGAARDAIVGKVLPMRSLDALAKPWPPLPDCLELAPESAGKGRGIGGRDLGPLSTGGLAAGDDAVFWQPTPVQGWLAAPVDAPKAMPKAETVRAGAKFGNRWWARADADAQGVLHLKQVFGVGRLRGVLALPIVVASATKLQLPWSGDIAAMEVFLDGRSVFKVATRRRFGVDEAPMTIACEPGRHLLLVRVDGWGLDPRWAIGAADGLVVEPPEAIAPVEVTAKWLRLGRHACFDVKPSAPVHWAPPPGGDFAELRDPTGNVLPVEWEWTDAGVLRLKTTAPVAAKQEMRIVWKGLRDLHGRPLQPEPTVVRVP